MRAGVAYAILLVLVAAAGALMLAPGLCTQDDAFISFRYARNLIEGHGLVFNPGERVEGITNLLWTLLLAAGMALGAEPARLSRALGMATVLLLVVVVFAIARRADRARSVTGGTLAAAIVALSCPVAMEGVQGLETVFFAALVTLGAGLAAAGEARRAAGLAEARLSVLAGLALACAGMTRPEGLGVAGLVGLALALRRLCGGERVLDGHLVRFAGAFLALWLPFWLARWGYYGWPLPNTFYAKTGGGWRHVQTGLAYEWAFVRLHPFLLGLAGAALGALLCAPRGSPGGPQPGDRRAPPLAWVAGTLVLGYAGYVVTVGGDFKATFRFLIPVLGLFAVLVDGWLGAALERLRAPPAARSAALGLAIALVALDGWRNSDGALRWSAARRAYMLEGGAAGRWIGANARPGDTLAIHAAGVIPYYAGIPTIDMWGLSDLHIAHLQMPESKGAAGHEKKDPAYVFARRPTYYVHSAAGLGPAPVERLEEIAARELGLPALALDYVTRSVEITAGEGDDARRLWFSFLVRAEGR